MTRRSRSLLVALVALVLLAAIWVAGGFLWPRPQFDRPGTPWSGSPPSRPEEPR